MSDVTLGDIMVELQRMDARIDALSTELYQVNIRVDQIVWWQVVIGGFVSETSPPPTLEAFEVEDKGWKGNKIVE